MASDPHICESFDLPEHCDQQNKEDNGTEIIASGLQPQKPTKHGALIRVGNANGASESSIADEHLSHEKYKITPPKETTKVGWADSVKGAFVIWFRVLLKIVLVLTLSIVFTWVYYLPAIMLSSELLDKIEDVVYVKVRDFISIVAFWSCIGLAAVEVFSFQFSKTAIYFAGVPGFALGTVIRFSFGSNSILFSNIGNFAALFAIGYGFYLIYKTKKPENMTEQQESYFSMTKDGSVSALLKGLIIVYILVTFILYNILGTYLKSSFMIQLVLRFTVFPICFNLSEWIQMRVIFNLSKEHTEKRMVINKLCNHYIQFLGRVLISNISTDGALSFEFIFVNFTASVIEMASVITFKHRTKLFYRFQRMLSIIYSRTYCGIKSRKLVPIIPMEGNQHRNNDREGQLNQEENGTIVNGEDTYIKELVLFRAKYIYDDVASEIYSILLAPLLMYFTHRIVRTSTFQPIQSFKECVYQILIQLIFELFSDITTISYEIHQGNIDVDDVKKWKPVHPTFSFLWSIYCLAHMHISILLIYS